MVVNNYGYLSDLYPDNEIVTASFYNKSGSMASGQYTPGYSATADLETVGFFWRGSMADKFINDKIKPDVAGVFVFNYSNYTTAIEESSKVTIDSKDYSVIYLDNVGEQNEIIVCPLKEM